MRLFCGIEIGGVWYNHASLSPIDEIKRNIFSAFDNSEMTTARIVEEMCKIALDKVYPHIPEDPSTADESLGIEITPAQILDLKMVEGWSIGFELLKQLKNDEYFTFSESFRCDRCSRSKESYTTIEESWQKLIDDGFIELLYLDTPEDMRWTHTLPVPVQMAETGSLKGLEFYEVEREQLSIYQVKQIQSDAELYSTELRKIYAYIDQSIRSIPGFSQKHINEYVKRNLRNSFSKRFLSHYDNIEELQNVPEKNRVGFDGRYRHVGCKDCGSELGRDVSGGLDYTNFFDYLIPRKSRQSSKMII